MYAHDIYSGRPLRAVDGTRLAVFGLFVDELAVGVENCEGGEMRGTHRELCAGRVGHEVQIRHGEVQDEVVGIDDGRVGRYRVCRDGVGGDVGVEVSAYGEDERVGFTDERVGFAAARLVFGQQVVFHLAGVGDAADGAGPCLAAHQCHRGVVPRTGGAERIGDAVVNSHRVGHDGLVAEVLDVGGEGEY